MLNLFTSTLSPRTAAHVRGGSLGLLTCAPVAGAATRVFATSSNKVNDIYTHLHQ